jgi:hypothetical protein
MRSLTLAILILSFIVISLLQCSSAETEKKETNSNAPDGINELVSKPSKRYPQRDKMTKVHNASRDATPTCSQGT